MAKRSSDVDALVKDIVSPRKDEQIESLLHAALAEPLPVEERLRQVERVLEALRGLGLFGKDDERDLHLLVTLGRTYHRFSHLEKAYETYEAALILAERLRDAKTRAELLRRMGRVLSRWNRWEEALDYLDRSWEIYLGLDDVQGQASVMSVRGIIFHEQGDYEAAQEAYETALGLAEQAGDRQIVADVLN
ncbi:tetratricopeptide repeat protein, partial [bacterium]|nr:tetratricopeptide repeat protein [bacterium]